MAKKTFTMRQADKHDYSACSMYKGICQRITDEYNSQKTTATKEDMPYFTA